MKKFLVTVIAGYLGVAALAGITVLMSGRSAKQGASGDSVEDVIGSLEGVSGRSSAGPSGRLLSEVKTAEPVNRAFKTFYRDGRLSSHWIYREGLLTGVCVLYRENGRDFQEIPFSRGRQEGPLRSYDDAGNLRLQTPYHEGRISGAVKEYYPGGASWFEISYEAGRPAGPVVLFSENGTREFVSMAAAEPGGLTLIRTYFNDGRESGLWPVKDGKLSGQARLFRPGGGLSRELSWQEGVLEGAVKTYDDQGRVLEESVFDQGVREGPSRWYYPDGELWVEMIYQDGVLKELPRAYSEGKSEDPEG